MKILKMQYKWMDDDTFLRCLESSMLSDLTFQSTEAIFKVYIVNPKFDESKKKNSNQ
jgi:hypothetical protein